LKAALEQVMGHEVQTMTLSYTDSGSPRLRVGFSVTLLVASSPAATSTAPAVPAPSPGRPPSSVVRQATKLRLLKAALEQVMGHEVQTMTLSSDIVWDVWDVH